MHTAGHRRSGRTLLIVVLVVLLIALVVIVWERNVRATAPLAPPVKPRTEMVPVLPDPSSIPDRTTNRHLSKAGQMPGTDCTLPAGLES